MKQRYPTLICILPPALLIALLSLNVYVFGDNALFGSNQLILIFAAAVTVGIAMFFGRRWDAVLDGITTSIAVALPAVLILLLVGSLSGTWLLSGIIPTMIYYGLHVLHPDFFIVAACLISAIVSISTGSSWTTSATVGIALMGIGSALGIHPAMVAGAVISGAYFGDKLSPLSDTTNLASGVAGVDLFTHIRYMLVTTGPSMLIALGVFIVLGLGDHDSSADVTVIQQGIYEAFNINALLLLAPGIVIAMIVKKVPALPALFFGAILGALLALIFQQDLIKNLAESIGANHFGGYAVVLTAFFGDIALQTDSEELNELLSSGGMAGMLNTIWLIVSAMVFGGAMAASGLLKQLTELVLKRVRTAGQLFTATVGTCIFTNVSASDQYLAIIVPSQMYKDAFRKQGLSLQNLSRTVEDSGTATSVLVPWNTCGAFHASVLGVATLDYLPFAVFCFVSPLMTLLVGISGFRLARANKTDDEAQNNEAVKNTVTST